MENALKALYMAAGLLIGVMVISVLVYIFRNGARLGENYELNTENLQTIKFNNQFNNYAKVTNQTSYASEGYSFIEKGCTASDVITCANLAMSINKQNDYDERNMVQIIVVLDASTKYYIHSMPNQPRNRFVKNLLLNDTTKQITDFNDTNSLDFYEFLKKYNEVRIVDINSDNYKSTAETIYKYYFDVDKDENGVANQAITVSELTGKINKIVFTLNPTEHFDDTTYWTETR